MSQLPRSLACALLGIRIPKPAVCRPCQQHRQTSTSLTDPTSRGSLRQTASPSPSAPTSSPQKAQAVPEHTPIPAIAAPRVYPFLLAEEVDFLFNHAPKYLSLTPSQLENVRRILSVRDRSAQNYLNRRLTQQAFARTGKVDTGSSEVQISLLTNRINNVQRHMDRHPKDLAHKRQLRVLRSKRWKLCKYLKRKDLQSYYEVLRANDILEVKEAEQDMLGPNNGGEADQKQLEAGKPTMRLTGS